MSFLKASPALAPLRRSKWRTLATVCVAVFVDYLTYGIFIPLTPLSPAGTNTDEQVAALLMGYAIGLLATTSILACTGDRIGCRALLIFGAVMCGVQTLLAWLAPGFWLMFAARCAGGSAAAATWTAGLALLAQTYASQRLQVISLAMMSSGAGFIAGPWLGGYLYGLGGYSMPLAVSAVVIAVDALLRLGLPRLGRGAKQAAWRADTFDQARRFFLSKAVLTPVLAIMLAAAAWAVAEALLPNRLLHGVHAEAALIGFVFTLSAACNCIGAPLVTVACLRLGANKMMCIGALSMAAALALLSVSNEIRLVGASLCLVSIAFACLLNPASAELGSAVERQGRNCYAAAYAVYNLAYAVGMIGGNAFAAMAALHASFACIVLCTAVLLLACAPLILFSDSSLRHATRIVSLAAARKPSPTHYG